MNSLFKCVTLPLLAVAAACTLIGSLCVHARAATATWDVCQNTSYTYTDSTGTHTIYYFDERVACSMTGYTEWNTDIMHNNRLGGGDDHTSLTHTVSAYSSSSGGDFTDPMGGAAGGVYVYNVAGGGTYNSWCICSGGDSTNGAWDVSTGGTTYHSF